MAGDASASVGKGVKRLGFGHTHVADQGMADGRKVDPSANATPSGGRKHGVACPPWRSEASAGVIGLLQHAQQTRASWRIGARDQATYGWNPPDTSESPVKRHEAEGRDGVPALTSTVLT